MGRRYNKIKILVKEDRTPYTGKRDLSGGWRKKIISESDWTPVAGSIANSTGTTFEYPGGSRVTVSGLGGVETTPSTVTVNQFGDVFDVPGPNYSQLGLQGYAPPLGGVQRQTQQSENERIDAEIRKLEEQIKDSKAKETAAIDAWNAELRATMDRHGREWEAVLKKDGVYNPEKHKGLQARHDAEIEAVWDKEPKTEPYETERQNLRSKIFELEKQRPINQQLDASQQAYPNLPFMGARVQSAVGARQSSFSTSDTSQGSYDDFLRDEGMTDPQDGASGPQYSRFGPFRSDLHYQFEAGKISERYRKKIDAVYDYYSDGAGSYRTMKPVMDLEAERDYLIRELSIKKTAQDRAYNKAVDQYAKKLEAEKLARRARAAAAPAPPGSVPLPVGPSIWSSGSTTPPPALRDYRNTSPISPAMSANIGTAGKIMIDYLTKGWDNRVVADNEYLGRDYIDNQFFKNVIFDNDKTVVGGADAVVGTGQPPRVDPKTGEIVVRANFDFNKNEYEASGDPEKQEFAQRLKRFGGMSDYALDAIVDGLPGNLGTLAGMAISPFVAGSKSIGRGNNIPIVIRFTPQELKRKNKEQYDQLVRMGLIKESVFDKIKKHR